MRSLKSVLGTSLIDETTRLGRERTSFRDVIAYYLGAVKRRAEQATGRELCDVVHGRPAHFVDGAPEALRSTRFGDALTTCELSSDRLPKILIVERQAQIGGTQQPILSIGRKLHSEVGPALDTRFRTASLKAVTRPLEGRQNTK
jgi:hypothetical protein